MFFVARTGMNPVNWLNCSLGHLAKLKSLGEYTWNRWVRRIFFWYPWKQTKGQCSWIGKVNILFLFFLVPRSWCSGFCVSQSIDFADLSDPVHPTPDGFENRGFTLKAHQMFSVHTMLKKCEREALIWKRIKCSPSTLCWRKLKAKALIWKRIKCFPSTLCWRHVFQMFSIHTRTDKLKQQQSTVILDLCLKKTQTGKEAILETSSSSGSSVLKVCSVHIETQRWRFQIPPVWRAFAKSSVFVTD